MGSLFGVLEFFVVVVVDIAVYFGWLVGWFVPKLPSNVLTNVT